MKLIIDILKQTWDYLKIRKKYWLAPLLITIFIFIILAIFTDGPILSPFIYSLTN